MPIIAIVPTNMDINTPLDKNPLRPEDTLQEEKMHDRAYERLRQDAIRWRDPNYRAFRAMTFNKGE